jgi:hypothetical protein
MYTVSIKHPSYSHTLDCVMVIGNEKGYVQSYDIMTDPKRKKVTFDP